MVDSGNLLTANGSPLETPDPLTHLEQRVRRLEDAVVQLQDTRPLEERVVERLSARQTPDAGKSSHPPVAMVNPEPPPQPIPTAIPVVTAPPTSATTWLGLFFDTWTELRSLVFMYIDRRYRMRWTGFLLPPVLFGLIMTSIFWFPGLSWAFNFSPMLATLLNVPIVLIMGYFLYRLLTWEARRYREAVADLPRVPRL